MTRKSCTVVSHTRSRPISVMAVIVATGQLTILLQHGGKMLIGAMKLWVGIVHCESKKQGTTILSITSPNVDRFFNFFFTDRFTSKFATKP